MFTLCMVILKNDIKIIQSFVDTSRVHKQSIKYQKIWTEFQQFIGEEKNKAGFNLN